MNLESSTLVLSIRFAVNWAFSYFLFWDLQDPVLGYLRKCWPKTFAWILVRIFISCCYVAGLLCFTMMWYGGSEINRLPGVIVSPLSLITAQSSRLPPQGTTVTLSPVAHGLIVWPRTLNARVVSPMPDKNTVGCKREAGPPAGRSDRARPIRVLRRQERTLAWSS